MNKRQILRKTIFLLLILAQLSYTKDGHAQHNELNKTITIKGGQYTLPNILDVLMIEKGLNISYNNKILKSKAKVNIPKGTYPVKAILEKIARQAQLSYTIRDEIIVFKTKTIKAKFTISGTVKDSLTGETIPYATIINGNSSTGVSSNKYGFYSLVLPAGKYRIVFSYLGYKEKVIDINLAKNLQYEINLTPAEIAIDEVLVESKNTSSKMEERLTNIDMKQVKTMPSSVGESDVMRNMQNLPGIISIAEVSGGFNVRGGGIDQNLILLDEAIVYNPNHMEGFFSVFNSDVIKNTKIYKGNMPANYGGRISSVIDLTQKDGNMKTFHAEGTVGNIAAKINLEGPIVEDKISYNLSLRRSYVDVFFDYVPDKMTVELDQIKGIYFYDINAKLNYKINDKNRIYLSAYNGHDVLRVNDYNQEYGNLTTTLRYNHVFSDKLFSNTSLIYSDYNMVDGESEDLHEWENVMGLTHYQFKNEFNYYLYKNNLKIGIDGIYRIFYPGELEQSNELSDFDNIKMPEQHAFESAVYIDDQITINDRLECQLGLRFSMYHYLGNEEIYNYEPGIPRNITSITDTINYQDNELIQFYHHLEPRVNIKYKINSLNMLKLSYNKTAQYIHLITNTITPTPYDMWKPSNNNIQPLVGHQFTLGYFTSLFAKKVELSVEGFYKETQNVLDVKPGADVVLNRTLDADLIEGKGKAYGVEVLLEKKGKKSQASIAYTYMRSLREVNQMYVEEKILPAGYYPANFDIPHTLSVSYQIKAGERGAFSANFTYMSGRPVTFPDGQYFYFGNLMPYYSAKNQHRLPNYHRLDFSYTVQSKKNSLRRWQGLWVFSLYNVYARNNPYSIYLRRVPSTRNTEAVKFSILGSVVPSIAYSFKF